jgi:hypothetical protein
MWLPAFKFIKGLFSLKGSFTLNNGSDYEGPYIETSSGEFFTGKTLTSESKKLLPIEGAGPEVDFDGIPVLLKTESPVPTPTNYKQGFFLRYFLEDTRDGRVLEVGKASYGIKGKKLFINTAEVKWVLDKPVKDLFNQGYLYKGAASRNRQAIVEASQKMSKLRDIITDYGKFADIESDVEGFKFIDLPEKEQKRLIRKQSPSSQQEPLVKQVPTFLGKKRMERKLKENLYTSGGRYKISGSSSSYIGFYHIHPQHGVMEGAVHTSNPHRHLEPYQQIPNNNTTSNTQNNTGGSGNYRGSTEPNVITNSSDESNSIY